ncbi:hypothetical protein QYM36_006457 [Artemia franciscana]|uniref:Uncharacterized protein n=1 Tax=Artemia franciscana TaxID=6661 RepID=A0AA88L9Y3_ARTSF|nr:hypothetical protein QYM36_006457 [Artemia franciscana]
MCDFNNEDQKENGRKFKMFALYKRIFYGSFNLDFAAPVKESCGTCEKFVIREKSALTDSDKEQARSEKAAHESFFRNACHSKRSDIEAATDSEGRKEVECFDLQQCLPTPALKTKLVFFFFL